MTPAETATALATDVLAEASRRGIALTAQGDRLECESPKGAMTPEFRAMLVEHKPEVIRLLGLPFVVGPPQPPPGSDPATWHPAWRQLAREQAAMRRMLDGVTWAESEYLTYRNLTDPRLAGIYRPEGLDPVPNTEPPTQPGASVEDAAGWLAGYLFKEPDAASALLSRAAQAGYPDPVMRRAAALARVVISQSSDGENWSLPSTSPPLGVAIT